MECKIELKEVDGTPASIQPGYKMRYNCTDGMVQFSGHEGTQLYFNGIKTDKKLPLLMVHPSFVVHLAELVSALTGLTLRLVRKPSEDSPCYVYEFV